MKAQTIILLAAALLATSCRHLGSSHVEADNIKIVPDNIVLEKGQTASLSTIIEPADASGNEVTWSSSKDEIASVDSKGVVTGVSKGTTSIWASVDNCSTRCSVTVFEPSVVNTGTASVTISLNTIVSFTMSIRFDLVEEFSKFNGGIVYGLHDNDLEPGSAAIVPIPTLSDGSPDLSGEYQLRTEAMLSGGFTYYYRAYAVFDGKEYYGDILTFKVD